VVEVVGFVIVPAFCYALGVREQNVRLIRWAAVLTVLGVVINRLNVSLVAFNWHLPAAQRYVPSLMEVGISLFIVTLGVVAYRFAAMRMPIFYAHPDYPQNDH
jgi:hypothetical protein